MSQETTTRETGSAAIRFLMRAAGSLHRGLFRLSGGRLGKAMGPMQILLLTTIGRKSGQARTWPLAYFRDDDRLVVVASAGDAASFCVVCARSPSQAIVKAAQATNRQSTSKMRAPSVPLVAEWMTMLTIGTLFRAFTIFFADQTRSR